jgi:GLPGLI family protein
MTRYIIFVTLSLVISINGFSQELLDSSFLKCQYDFSYYLRSNDDKQLREDIFILQIGSKVTKCYSYYTFIADSIHKLPNGKEVLKKLFTKALKEANGGPALNFPYRRSKEFIYKNYPKNKMTVVDGISADEYIYEDSLYAQKWLIQSDTARILGYLCQKALCSFRGRNYTAWFTESIAVSQGPWKFMGLPGLIIKVYDNEQTFTFTLRGIEQIKEPIFFFKSLSPSGKFIKTKRENFLNLNNKFLNNQGTYIKAETGLDIFSNTPEPNSKINLLELQ